MFTPGAFELLGHGFGARFTVVGLSFLLWNCLKFTRKVICYPHNMCTTVAPMNIPHCAVHCCSSQGLQLVKIVGDFLPNKYTQHLLVL